MEGFFQGISTSVFLAGEPSAAIRAPTKTHPRYICIPSILITRASRRSRNALPRQCRAPPPPLPPPHLFLFHVRVEPVGRQMEASQQTRH